MKHRINLLAFPLQRQFMFAYDVDGDGDNDVITGLSAHAYGLAWFEQLPENKGFKKHMIMGDPKNPLAHGVVFSQAHGIARHK